MCMIGSCYVFCSNRRAVIPFCISFDLNGNFGTGIVPNRISVCKERIHFGIQRVPHVKGLIYEYTGSIALCQNHCVV